MIFAFCLFLFFSFVPSSETTRMSAWAKNLRASSTLPGLVVAKRTSGLASTPLIFKRTTKKEWTQRRIAPHNSLQTYTTKRKGQKERGTQKRDALTVRKTRLREQNLANEVQIGGFWNPGQTLAQKHPAIGSPPKISPDLKRRKNGLGKSCLQSLHISVFLALSLISELVPAALPRWVPGWSVVVLSPMSLPPGRPRMTINAEWLKERVREGRDDKDIVAQLARMGVHVSPKTIQRRRIEFGMHCCLDLLFFSPLLQTIFFIFFFCLFSLLFTFFECALCLWIFFFYFCSIVLMLCSYGHCLVKFTSFTYVHIFRSNNHHMS